MEKNNEDKNNKKIIFIFLVSIIIIICLICIILFNNKELKLKKQFRIYASDYYDNNIKGTKIGIDRQTITLEKLKENGYDISLFDKENCDMRSYVYIILKDSNETDISKIEYTIEYHLTCEKFNSNNE